MFTHYRTQGIILSSYKRGEADEIFIIYTKDFGKISITGKSIRKNGSKLRMNMSLFSFVEVGFIQGKSYNTLTDVVVVSDFKKAKKSLGKLSLFYRISEIFLSLIHDEEEDENIFLFLVASFQKINNTSLTSNDLRIFFCFFSFNLLYFLGYKLYIRECVLCKESVNSDGYFNPKEGGIICNNCFAKDFYNKNCIYIEDVNILRKFLNLEERGKIDADANFFTKILDNYLEFIPKQGEYKAKKF